MLTLTQLVKSVGPLLGWRLTTVCLQVGCVLAVLLLTGGSPYGPSPLLSPDAVPCHPGLPYTPVADVLAAIVNQLEVTSVVVIEEEASDINELQIGESQLQRPILVYNYEISRSARDRDVSRVLKLQNALSSQEQHFIVFCSVDCLAEILRQVNELDAAGGAQGVLTYSHRWLLVTNTSSASVLDQFVGNIAHVTAISRATVTPSACGSVDDYDISSAFWTSEGRRFQLIGRYIKGSLQLSTSVFPNIQHGFNNRTFTITVNTWGPFLHRTSPTEEGTYDGMCIEMLKTMAAVLNFSYVLVEPADGKWASLNNGTWGGIVGQLLRKEVDLSFAPLAVSTKRETVVDFTFPFFLEYTAVLYARTDRNTHKFAFFLAPFKWIVWGLIVISLPVVALATCSLATLSCKETTRQLTRPENAVWFHIGSFLIQGGVHIPRSVSVRLVVGFWWMFCYIVVATYSGNLVAFLAVSKSKAPFDTLEELSQQNTYAFGTIGGTIWEEMLEGSTTEVYQRMWRNIQARRRSMYDFDVVSTDQTAHIERAKQGYYAVISDITSFELEKSKSCDVTIMGEKFFPLRYAIAVQNNSAYRAVISQTVMHLHESGLLGIWKRHYWPRSEHCQSSKPVRAIKVTDLLGMFYTLGCILLVALVTLLTEIVVRKYLRSNRTVGADLKTTPKHS